MSQTTGVAFHTSTPEFRLTGESLREGGSRLPPAVGAWTALAQPTQSQWTKSQT
jgi:hypothetical protein